MWKMQGGKIVEHNVVLSTHWEPDGNSSLQHYLGWDCHTKPQFLGRLHQLKSKEKRKI